MAEQEINIKKVNFDGTPLVSFNGVVRKMTLGFYLNITHKSQQKDAFYKLENTQGEQE